MKYLGYLFSGLIATLPMLWIDNYTICNPIWWTVFLAWIFGRIFGFLERENY